MRGQVQSQPVSVHPTREEKMQKIFTACFKRAGPCILMSATSTPPPENWIVVHLKRDTLKHYLNCTYTAPYIHTSRFISRFCGFKSLMWIQIGKSHQYLEMVHSKD